MSKKTKLAALGLSAALAFPTGAVFASTASAAPVTQVQTARLQTADKTNYVKYNDVNLRTGPGTTYDKAIMSAGNLPKGTKVTVHKTQNGWSKVTITGYWTGVNGDYTKTQAFTNDGWIRSDLLTSTKPEFIPTYGTWGMTLENLILRKGPGKNYQKVLTIEENKIVEVGKTQGNWRQARYNNKTGWVNLDYVALGDGFCGC